VHAPSVRPTSPQSSSSSPPAPEAFCSVAAAGPGFQQHSLYHRIEWQ
jgi:hypothetical protein